MGQLNLLIVDDEEMLLDSLSRFFTRKGFNVTTANGVLSARELIKKNEYQILITDMRMPDGLGIEVIVLQRQLRPASIIFCATGFSEEDENSILEKGADAVIAKPFEKKAILEKIFTALSR